MTLNFQDDIQQIIMLKAILKTGVSRHARCLGSHHYTSQNERSWGISIHRQWRVWERSFFRWSGYDNNGYPFSLPLRTFFLQHSTFFVSVCNISAKAKAG